MRKDLPDWMNFARADATPPMATDIKADWKAEKYNGKWYACGTSLGDLQQVKCKSEYDAKRYVDKMNANAKEAEAINKKWAEERAEKLKELRAKRGEERSRQGSLFDSEPKYRVGQKVKVKYGREMNGTVKKIEKDRYSDDITYHVLTEHGYNGEGNGTILPLDEEEIWT